MNRSPYTVPVLLPGVWHRARTVDGGRRCGMVGVDKAITYSSTMVYISFVDTQKHVNPHTHTRALPSGGTSFPFQTTARVRLHHTNATPYRA